MFLIVLNDYCGGFVAKLVTTIATNDVFMNSFKNYMTYTRGDYYNY